MPWVADKNGALTWVESPQMPPLDVMVDLETLGTEPGSAILNIGACAFDPRSGYIGPDFKVHIDLTTCLEVGMTISANTVDWWMTQGEDARNASFGPHLEKHSLFHALYDFAAYFRRFGTSGKIWGHGPSMDVSLTEWAMRKLGIEVPWKYNGVRCTRTIYDVAGVEPQRSRGTHHDSLVDAQNQAIAVHEAYKRLGKS